MGIASRDNAFLNRVPRRYVPEAGIVLPVHGRIARRDRTRLVVAHIKSALTEGERRRLQ
jgi:hypothetical protein